MMGDNENNKNEDHSHWEKELERLAKEADAIKEKIMGARRGEKRRRESTPTESQPPTPPPGNQLFIADDRVEDLISTTATKDDDSKKPTIIIQKGYKADTLNIGKHYNLSCYTIHVGKLERKRSSPIAVLSNRLRHIKFAI